MPVLEVGCQAWLSDPPALIPQKREAYIGADATGWLDNANEMLGIVDHLTNGVAWGDDLITDFGGRAMEKGID